MDSYIKNENQYVNIKEYIDIEIIENIQRKISNIRPSYPNIPYTIEISSPFDSITNNSNNKKK